MPLWLTSELNNAPSLLSIARFNESSRAGACGSVQTFAAKGGTTVAVGVKTAVAIGGIGEGVSVVIKTNGAGAGGVEVVGGVAGHVGIGSCHGSS